jgi:hypothetical protein
VYEYIMPDEDVDITVSFENEDSDYFQAMVQKLEDDHVTPDTVPGNTVVISNQTKPSLPHGVTWTNAQVSDSLQVIAMTAPGYYVADVIVRPESGGVLGTPFTPNPATWTGITGPVTIDLPMQNGNTVIQVIFSTERRFLRRII